VSVERAARTTGQRRGHVWNPTGCCRVGSPTPNPTWSSSSTPSRSAPRRRPGQSTWPTALPPWSRAAAQARSATRARVRNRGQPRRRRYRGEGNTDAKDAAIIANQAQMRRDLRVLRLDEPAPSETTISGSAAVAVPVPSNSRVARIAVRPRLYRSVVLVMTGSHRRTVAAHEFADTVSRVPLPWRSTGSTIRGASSADGGSRRPATRKNAVATSAFVAAVACSRPM
jgi:hypothetical protein